MSESGSVVGRRVARNTGVYLAGEVISRAAAFALFAVMARELGRGGFGDFTFAVSVALLLSLAAGLSTDEIVARTVAADERTIDNVLWDALALKLVGAAAALAVVGAIAAFGGYRDTVAITLVLIALGAALDLIAGTVYAVFQGLNDLGPQALSRILQGLTRAAGGIIVILAGGGVVVVAAVYAGASVVPLAYVSNRLRRRVRPHRRPVSIAGAKRLAMTSIPIAIWGLLEAGVVSATAIILSALEGNVAVGVFGAAVRLVDSSFVLSTSFVAAMYPLLVRGDRRDLAGLKDVYEVGMKVIVAGLLPLSILLLGFAEPLVRLIYGSAFAPAATVVRILAMTVVIHGITQLSTQTLIARGRQGLIPWIAGAVTVISLALTVTLVPSHSYDGAAIGTLVGVVVYATFASAASLRLTGRISILRVAVTPIVAAAGIALVTALGGSGAAAFAGAVAAYIVILAMLEHRFHPGDLRWLVLAIRGRLRPGRALPDRLS